MKLPFLEFTWLRFAFQNTLRNRRRSLVTITIAALGSAAILTGGGFALSTYEALEESSARTTGHLIVANPAQFGSDEEVPLQHGLTAPQPVREQLLSDPEVRYVLPRIEFSGLISNGDKSTIMIASGIDPDAEFSIKGPFLSLKSGSLLQSDSKVAAVVIGETLAASLKAQPGSNLTLMASTTDGALNALDVEVKGIVSTGIPEMDKRLVYTDIKTAQKLLNTQRISSFGVFLSSMQATLPAQQRLQAALPALKVQTWLDQAFFYQAVRGLYNRIFGALGMIICVIVVFVVANAMAMAILERTREIGSLRAMGTMPQELMTSLSYEGMLLGGSGALLGSLLAVGISLLLICFPVQMPPPPGRSVGYPLLISLNLNLTLYTILAMVLLAMLSSWLVSRKTLRQPIVEALAYL